jgi:CHAD domain-containing protein
MRSAIRLFRGALPKGTVGFFAEELKWLGSVFGHVRDLDVFLLNFNKLEKMIESSSARHRKILEDWIADHRSVHLENLRNALVSQRLKRFRTRMSAYIKRPLPKRPTAPLALTMLQDVAPEIILEKHKSVLKQGRKVIKKPKLKNFHNLRIQVKKLRYACEFVSPAYGKALREFIRETVKIQDCLGELQDTVFTRNFIDYIRSEWGGKVVEPKLLFMLGEIYQLQSEIARTKQALFMEIWKSFDTGSTFSNLLTALHRKTENGIQ